MNNSYQQSLIKMCEQKISIRHYKQVIRLKEIGLMMIHDEFDEQEEEEDDIYGIMEQSTEIGDEEEDQKQ